MNRNAKLSTTRTLKISVVIPAYNEQELLSGCLEALLAQTRPPDEIIVVDNNSTDQTAETARSYGALVIREKMQGIMPAVYTGMAASTGDIIARCDADSVVPNDWIERIEEILTTNPYATGVTGPGVFYGTSSLRANWAQLWYMYAYFVLVGSALANWPLFGSNCALRRAAWQSVQNSVHRERTDIHDDIEISSHLAPKQQIVFKPSLKVGVSARALRCGDMKRRYRYGWNTLVLHWPANSPWRRWRAKLSFSEVR